VATAGGKLDKRAGGGTTEIQKMIISRLLLA